MKNLDNTFIKIEKKVPSIVFSVWVILGLFCSGLYDFLTTSGQLIADLNARLAEVDSSYSGIVTPQMAWLIFVFSTFFSYAIFELILNLVYGSMFRNRLVNSNANHFKNVVRFFYGLISYLLGLTSLFGYISGDVYVYTSATLDIIIITGLLLMAYLTLQNSVVNPKMVGSALKKLFIYYFAIMSAVGLFNLVTVLIGGTYSLHEKIASGVNLATLAGLGVAIYYCSVIPLIKKEKEYFEIVIIEKHKDDNNSDNNDEIYKGYGF